MKYEHIIISAYHYAFSYAEDKWDLHSTASFAKYYGHGTLARVCK